MMKSLAVATPDYATPVLSPARFLRIAVPSWRAVGIHARVATDAETQTLSREEIQFLFHGELNGRARRKGKLTEAEEQQKRIAQRIRHALYPGNADAFGH